MILLRLLLAPWALIFQSIFLALGQVWVNKMRSLLTALGIIIGVASVTAVVAALTGMKKNVIDKFESYGANRIYIYPMMPDDGHHHRWQELHLRPNEFDGLLEHCPDVAGFTRTCEMNKTISFGTHSREVDLLGIEPSWHAVTSRPIVTGRPFSLIDNDQARPVCLINAMARDTLEMDIDPTGQVLMIGNRRFTVIGMIDNAPDDPWEGGDRARLEVYVPFKLLFYPGREMWGQAASRSADASLEARAELHAFFRHSRRLGVSKPDNFDVWAVQSQVDDIQSMSATVTAVAAGIVGISLLVGGIGIMNIMLVSVSERTREIGLRKAVGARPSAILLQFLIEAVVLCLLGGLAGVAGGEGITMVLRRIPQANLEKAVIPVWAVAVSFGFAAGVGLIFGMFPAIKAAALDPIEALRHE